ncbi:MAG: metalloregulator ArsR/SmtB family transcription factor [Bacteroidia bacterium]|jgi:DNA-binding transcriptional ArsR family regulator|nr:metalloregulator ArsR/SmtB family transcription factor [Bacteroidia bacterium]
MSLPTVATDHYTHQAELLKALAHPVRLAMLGLFSSEGALTVTEIHCKLGLEQAAASHHLGILKSRGIVTVEREGRNSVYKLKHGCLSQILACLNQCNPPAK